MVAVAEPIVRKRLSQAELDVICARHDRLFQARPGGARAVFAWMDLSGLSLRGRNLSDADFAAASLEGCDLTGCRLDNANFFGADLFEADLREGTIAAADAKLGFKVIEPRQREETQVAGACLAGANLQRSKMAGVIAIKADFSGAVMKDCKLVRANLKQADFRGADLAGADL